MKTADEILENPCFNFEPSLQGEDIRDLARRLFGEGGRFHLTTIEVVVAHSYGTPYRFGQMLRDVIGDDNAEIYRAGAIYFAYGDAGLVTYDPAKRQDAPAAVDWFAAVDQLAA